MSLTCHETGDMFEPHETIWCGTRTHIDLCSAVCDASIAHIPLELRRSSPCQPDEEGVDFHHLLGGRAGRFFPNVQIVSTRMGPFEFSISGETALTYVPKLYETYNRKSNGTALLP